jgi:hypothetical protein
MAIEDRNIDLLKSIIADAQATAPFERDGYVWAVATQDEFCERLGGWSISKFFRLTSKPPFIREVAKIDGSNKTLLREGEPGPKTAASVAKHMSSLLRRYRDRCRKALIVERDTLACTMTGVPETDALAEVRIETIDHLLNVLPTLTTGKEFGCLCGLAELWPEGYQIDILKTVLADWSAFMAGAKVAIWAAGDGGEKFFEFASMSVIRAFPQVAVELYVMDRQEQAMELTPELRRLSRYIQK